MVIMAIRLTRLNLSHVLGQIRLPVAIKKGDYMSHMFRPQEVTRVLRPTMMHFTILVKDRRPVKCTLGDLQKILVVFTLIL